MDLGFSTVMYEDTNLTYHDIICKASILGYDGIELNYKVWPSELNLNEIKKALSQFDVEVAAIGTRHMNVTHGLYLASPNKEVRIKALQYLVESMKIARKLNCNLIQAGWAFQGSKLETQLNIAWRQAVDSLRQVGRLAQKHRLRFVIEFACKQNAELVNTMDDALHMLKEVDDENVLVMADTFHIHAEKDSLRDVVLKASRKLGYVHLSDSDRLTPGNGVINFSEFISALKEIKYEGYMIMEFNPYPSPDEALGQAINYIKSLL